MFNMTFIGVIMNIIWVLVVLAALPTNTQQPDSILTAFTHNLPATVPLSNELHSAFLTVAALVFALLAVTSSFMANGTGLLGFMRDLSNTYLRTENKKIIAMASFGPPLLISLIYPNVFLKAIGVVGGIGETVLFGILPALTLLKYKTADSKIHRLAYFILAVSVFIFGYEVLASLGLVS